MSIAPHSSTGKKAVLASKVRPVLTPVRAALIPAVMQKRRQWIGWRWVRRSDIWQKLPVDPRNGKAAAVDNPATWGTFEEALAAVQAGKADGVGFVFTEDDPFAGIDLDDCRDPVAGKLAPWAQVVVDRAIALRLYVEVSPTGTGVKIFLRGAVPAEWIKKQGQFEVYSTGRFFCMTGHQLADVPGVAGDLGEGQELLDDLQRQMKAAKKRPEPSANGHAARGEATVERRAVEYLKKIPAAISGQGGHDATLSAARAVVYGFDLGPDRGFELLRDHYNPRCQPEWSEKELRHKCQEADVKPFDKPRGWLRDAERPGRGPSRNGKAHAERNGRVNYEDLPAIPVSTDEGAVNDAVVDLLPKIEDLFQRGGALVRCVQESGRPGRTEPLPKAIFRDWLSRLVRFETMTEDGVRSRHVPAWCLEAVMARAEWHGVRRLVAIVEHPVLRPDGTIHGTPGYDPATEVLLSDNSPAVRMPAVVARTHVSQAVADLLDVVHDFPFASDLHRSAWLAALLTPLARFAFAGCSPLFLVDANTRGSGKGLLLDIIALIVTGGRIPVTSYTSDEDELRKRITSIAMNGDRLAVFDNLTSTFGNGTLDAALTSTYWKDRLLGTNRTVEVPMVWTVFATGNNVTLAADTARRVCHVRLESPEERPEERTGFRHPHLLTWVAEQRPRLLSAALTILHGYCAAGRPEQGLKPWGSFEGWSILVRGAIVWAGLPDPGETRIQLIEASDVAASGMAALLEAIERLDPLRQGLTAAEIVERVGKPLEGDSEETTVELRDAIEQLCGKLDSRKLGYQLRGYRRRIFGGRFIDMAGTKHKVVKWVVSKATTFTTGGGMGGIRGSIPTRDGILGD